MVDGSQHDGLSVVDGFGQAGPDVGVLLAADGEGALGPPLRSVAATPAHHPAH